MGRYVVVCVDNCKQNRKVEVISEDSEKIVTAIGTFCKKTMRLLHQDSSFYLRGSDRVT